MAQSNRRHFIKLCGAGVGAAALSSLWIDRWMAGEAPDVLPAFFDDFFGISKEQIRKVLTAALMRGGEFSEIFFEYRLANSVLMEEDRVKESSEEVSLGAGIRVLHDLRTGYAYTSDLTEKALLRAAGTAASIASGSAKGKAADLSPRALPHQVYDLARPFHEAGLTARIDIAKRAYESAKKHDSRIVKARASLVDEIQYMTVANSEGLMAADARPQVRLRVFSTAESNGKGGTGQANDGGKVGLDFYRKVRTPEAIGKAASEEALILLDAGDPVAGEQPVVLGRGQSGVMIHEAVGHPLEGDGAWKQTSVMWDKMGKTVASPVVTIYDDATLPHLRGSLNIDDEGTPTEKVTLIEKGKLVNFLHDRISAARLKARRNGHGRRQTYRDMPIPRMANTNLAAGKSTPEEIIGSVKKGFYAKSYMGGQVQGTGKFVFSISLGYLVEDGRLTKPVKNATLIGTNVAILKDVEMVGNDPGMFLGTCGKGGQWAPVTAGTPTLKIASMTVGGRQ